MQMIIDTPFIIKRFALFLLTREGIQFVVTKLLTSVRVLLLIVYIISPFDLLPECIFGFVGLLDDFIIAVILLVIIGNLYY